MQEISNELQDLGLNDVNARYNDIDEYFGIVFLSFGT